MHNLLNLDHNAIPAKWLQHFGTMPMLKTWNWLVYRNGNFESDDIKTSVAKDRVRAFSQKKGKKIGRRGRGVSGSVPVDPSQLG